MPCTEMHKWQHYQVNRANKVEYRLYEEGSSTCLLSALRVDDNIYFSQREDFPTMAQSQPGKTPVQWVQEGGSRFVCAIMRKDVDHKHRTEVFKLYSHGCAGCDQVLHKYNCGYSRPAPRQHERQMLAHMIHSKQKIAQTTSEAHHMQVKLPALRDNAAFRCVWCPRTQPADKSGVVPLPAEDEVISTESQLPVWNAARGSLSLRFAEGRVKKASAKNFLLVQPSEKEPGKKGRRGGEEAVPRGVMQFGKSKKQTYVLDVRHPMSLLQAMGISLSTYGWKP